MVARMAGGMGRRRKSGDHVHIILGERQPGEPVTVAMGTASAGGSSPSLDRESQLQPRRIEPHEITAAMLKREKGVPPSTFHGWGMKEVREIEDGYRELVYDRESVMARVRKWEASRRRRTQRPRA